MARETGGDRGSVATAIAAAATLALGGGIVIYLIQIQSRARPVMHKHSPVPHETGRVCKHIRQGEKERARTKKARQRKRSKTVPTPSEEEYEYEYEYEKNEGQVNTYDNDGNSNGNSNGNGNGTESDDSNSKSKSKSKSNDVSKYEIVDTAADGDCLFHCFVTALQSHTVRSLREEVARRATQDQLDILKVIYEEARRENDWDQLQDYMFMQGVDTLDELRNAIRTKRYWGDEMALTALQDFTGLVPVVITEDGRGNFEVARRIAPQGSSTHPPADALFIILLLSHAHYRLVEYEGRAKMTIDMLPLPVRRRLFDFE